jgi:soluble lytic murein transglycosylase-like protein
MPGFLPVAPRTWLWSLLAISALSSVPLLAKAADRLAEHVTLTNGFDLICDHHEQTGDRMKLYTAASGGNFVEVAAANVASVESVSLPASPEVTAVSQRSLAASAHADLTKAELHEMLASAGAHHNLDVELLASVVRAESGGHTRALSRAGAQGLMQLMPKTAAQLGVDDSFRPDQNIAAGSAYLDGLLTRYHDNLALALAAYNAGPAAVDRWHGVPPYRETHLYVARIIRDFNASVKASRVNRRSSGAVAHAEVVQTPILGKVTP